jgi:sensor histidine kinase YesM
MLEALFNILLNAKPLNEFSIIFIGVILVIFVQNTVFYFNHKDKSYFWYALYALIILLDQLVINYDIDKLILAGSNSISFTYAIHVSLEWFYNSTYLFFVLSFAGEELFKGNGSQIIRKIVGLLFIVLVLLFITDTQLETFYVRKGFTVLAVPVLSILSIIVIKQLFSLKTATRNYIILGAVVFSVFSLLAFLTPIVFDATPALSWELFYLGVFLENIFFSTGLVVKQKSYLKEKNTVQKELITQMQENQQLKNKLTDTLRKEVEKQKKEMLILNKRAEEDKIHNLEIGFEKQIAELRVSSMQNQMNPHFVFNSLNSIKLYIIKNDQEKAVYYLNKFSKLIRKILSASRKKDVSLKEELETLELYVNIENIRFKNSIEFQLNIEDSINLSTIKIPPLVLQPFIENAIWHGLSPKEGKKVLKINVSKRIDNYIEITIIDNGVGRRKSAEIKKDKLHKKESIGLKLTEERLTSFCKDFAFKHKLSFIDLEKEGIASGTKVVILLPLR